jgi:N6-L-threonylcarbamoyladenine synthase
MASQCYAGGSKTLVWRRTQGLTLADETPILVLGIETTCDETAAAVIELGVDGQGRIMSNIELSQI